MEKNVPCREKAIHHQYALLKKLQMKILIAVAFDDHNVWSFAGTHNELSTYTLELMHNKG
jgi:hypothetical protein